MESGVNFLSDEESRWVVIGICLAKVLSPTLRSTVATELQNWYNLLSQPPIEIHKQVPGKHKNTLPPSKFFLNYKNINGNDVHKLKTSAYDYAVKDPLSLARLFVRPFMAKFTGFDDTMDLSALLSIMCEAAPFVKCGAAAQARNLKSKVRNCWAHCNFSKWTDSMFNDAIQEMQCLVRNINLLADVEKEVCDELEDWKNKVSDVFIDGRYLETVGESVCELRLSVETWKFQADTKMNEVVEKLDLIQSELRGRIEKNSKGIKRNKDQIDRNTSEIERLHKRARTEHHSEQKENYSPFAEQKAPYGLRCLPPHMVKRKSEVTDILELLEKGNKVDIFGRRAAAVGIRGMGGLGKTVLAQAVAWKVSEGPRQVVWLDIGQNPDCLKLINTVVKVFGGAKSFSDIVDAQCWLRKNMTGIKCLVVLDDVWKVDDAGVFDFLAGECQLLITSRNAEVIRGWDAAQYDLSIMPTDKARELLYQSANLDPNEPLTPNSQQIITDLLEQCRGLPLALSLVGSCLRDDRSEQDWKKTLDDLKNAHLERFRSFSPKAAYPYDNLYAAIDVSYQRLDENERKMFRYFAIFPEDMDIPSDILELLWRSIQTESGKTEQNDILASIERRSLIQKGPELHGRKSYRIHDVVLDFTKKKLQDTVALSDAQSSFVKVLRDQYVKGEWNSNQKDYYFKYLPYHIYSSEQQSELLHLFFDLHWLQQKVKHTNISSVVSDFRFLDPLSEKMKLLKSSLMLSADIIEKNPDSIYPQLLGRLYGKQHLIEKELVQQLQETCTKSCYLLPISPCLDLGGPEISRKTFGCGVCSLATCNSSADTVIICGLRDGSIRMFEQESRKEVQKLLGHQDPVRCLALSRSKTILASGSEDKTAILWNMDSHEQLFVLQMRGAVWTLDFSVDGQRLFTGSDNGLLSWFVATGERELLNSIPEHDSSISSLCTSPDGQYVATASFQDNSIKLWKADTLNIEDTLNSHTEEVTFVGATGKDNPMLVSASLDDTIRIWDLKTRREISNFKCNQAVVRSVAVSDDKKHIISGDSIGNLKLWCFHTGQLISCFEGHTDEISFVTILSNGSRVASASKDGSVRVWRLATGPYMEEEKSRDYLADFADIALSRDGSMCVSAAKDDTFKIWKHETAGQCITLRGNEVMAKSVAVSTDKRYFVSLSEKDDMSFSIKVWNLKDGSVCNKIDIDNKTLVEFVRFSSSGEQVVIGCNDSCVFTWDLQQPGAFWKKVILPSFDIVEIAFEESMIYTCSSDMHVCEINLGSGQVSTVRQGLAATVISPNGETVIRGKMNKIICWDVLTNVENKYNAGHPDDSIVTAVDFTSNGKFTLTGSSSGTLSLFDLECSEISQTFAKTASGVGIRFVCVLSDNDRFVLVDEANRVELRTFHDNGTTIELNQPDVQVTCIAALGLSCVLLGYDDGKLLCVYLNDKSQHKFKAHSNAISQVSGGLEGRCRRFVSGSIVGSVKLWKVEENFHTLMWSYDNNYCAPITALAFVPCSDGILIACGEEVKEINANGVVWSQHCHNHSSGVIPVRTETIRVVQNTIFGSFHRRITNDNGIKRTIDVDKWHFGQDPRYSGCFSLRERVLRVNNSRGVVAILGVDYLIIWNFKTGAVLHTLYIEDAKDITALALTPGDEFVLSASSYSKQNKALKLWKLENEECVEEFHFDQGVQVISCASNGMVCVGLKGGHVCFLRFNNLSQHSGN